MKSERFAVPDPVWSRLRATVATIERETARMSEPGARVDGASPPTVLAAAVADLVKQLALGPEPEYRECPTCGGIGMRAATLCIYCWTKLVPPAPAGREGAAERPAGLT